MKWISSKLFLYQMDLVHAMYKFVTEISFCNFFSGQNGGEHAWLLEK